MASTSSSHQQNAFSGNEPPNKKREVEESSRVFDVFINHRGPDVKLTLATQLYNSLKELPIKPFLDSEEKELGDSFPSTIQTAIRSASVHIAIFSKTYAESAWCLAELVLMLQSKAKIIPVFYQVEPSALRYIEQGVYAEAFAKYKEKGRYLDNLEEWKEALQQVSYTAGYEFKNSDCSDCKDIVSAVQKEVQRKELLYVAKYPVGLHKLVEDFKRQCLDELVEDFESQCGMKKAKEKAIAVGIFGMGGVGKTTLSTELFNQKRSKYTRASFLFNVREACASRNLPSLQSKILEDIFCEDRRFLSIEEGKSCLRDRLERSSSFSFLIVLDDIDHVDQLDALLVMDMLNKSDNSLVIITTRNVGVLVSAGIYIGYHLKGLNREDGRVLFCWHAFNKPYPSRGFEDLVQEFVNMCGGLPLSMIVLGRHVSGRPQWYWQDELEKVRNALPGDIQRKLKISIDTLDHVEKQIFMDIACFFIGKSITKAMNIWKGSGWGARHALNTLKEKCLVEEVQVRYLDYKWESSGNGFALRMHDHLRDLGREMALELGPHRLWRPQDLKFLELKGFRNILAETKGRCFHSILDKSMGCRITYFLGETEDGSDTSSLLWLQLEYLSWPEIDLNSDINSGIPSWIPLQYLQCLRISNGCLQKLWQSNAQVPSHLKELQILDTFLEEFPNFLGILDNMEKLVLHAKDIQTDLWSSLEPLRMNLRSLWITDSSLIGHLANNDSVEGTTLNSLYIYHLRRLWEGEVALNSEGTVMSNVEDLEIDGCRLVTKIFINENCCQRLQSLKISEMKNLIEVDLARIKTLKCLEITGCEKFKRFSATFGLNNLLELKISECPELEELNIAHLSCLEKITVENCKIWKSMSERYILANIVELNISQILELEELGLAYLICLERISIENCSHLKSVSGISNLAKLVEFKISGCDMLEFEYLCLSGMKCLERITIYGYAKMEYFELDGCEILKSIHFDCKNVVNLSIRYCPEVKKLTDLEGPSCLKNIIMDGCGNLKNLRLKGLENLENLECLSGNLDIFIYSCEKLQNIVLPTALISLFVISCRDLRRVAGAGDLIKLTRLTIVNCPALEELPSLANMSCLENIVINSCEKLQNIVLPTALISLFVISCRDLRRVAGAGDLIKLTRLTIVNCPALEELPSLANVSCLEDIVIDSWEKLQNIVLPTTLISLRVKSCRDLQRVAGAGDLKKLTRLVIKECPALEELPSLANMSCLEDIEIDSWEKLQNIVLPTTLISLRVKSCRDLQRVAGAGDLKKLTRLVIKECPALEELPSLANMSCLEDIEIDSWEKLQNVAGIEDLCGLVYMRLYY